METYLNTWARAHASEYPIATAMILKNVNSSTKMAGSEVEKIASYVIDQMPNRPFEDIQDVLVGVGVRLDELLSEGQEPSSDLVIKALEAGTLL